MGRQDRELYKDSNRMAAEYSKDAIRFAFYLNGAAATALFAKTQVIFVFPATLLACGAACAVFCMGLSYLVQLALAETWNQGGPLYALNIGPWKVHLTFPQIETGRVIAIAFWVGAMVLFFWGAYEAWQTASSLWIAV